ncbi:SDR family oxidoreductase [Methylocystis heyeri]|uniref:SDR family NAD(P)-dependent oxidoreductase n=1 Tax=Methylocystis heyeri TaxID=391905 RepID=A0A6B8KIE7_9HYPH|nr:NAD(P)-dependent oxidoreductase [Methylocystis heyeri]QGM47432.1 SDR family NAD(P)-dependent oxidoreductase [Methylocystis heyeri]
MGRSLAGKTLFITGASRGIGLAIALRAARDGANVAIVAKSAAPHPKLPGTIHTAAKEIEAAGGKALPLACDIRFEDQVEAAVAETAKTFGGLDILVNNASAIDLRGVETLDMKRYDLMQQVNARGAYLCSKLALPHLKKAGNPHILTLSPPLDLNPKWFAPNLAYTIAKYGMSLVTLGLARELAPEGVAVNSLWPETAIATAAVGNLLGGEAALRRSRKPEIVADAAHAVLTRPARSCSGNFFIDVAALREEGVTDFTSYAVDPAEEAILDFFLEAPLSEGVSRSPFHPNG